MRYKLLGHSGLRVSELSLGTMTFGEDWGWGAPRKTCRSILKAYADAGGNFIDTANVYTNGSSETMLGELLKGDRERYVVATKYTLGYDGKDPNSAGNSRKNMSQSIKASLERLQTKHIDLFWLHAWDFMTPIEEIMRGLDDLVRAGMVHYLGISDAPAWVIARANTLAEQHGWTPFTAMQMQYSLIERTIERELQPMARALDLALAAWSPLGAGVLTGKYAQGGSSTDEQARLVQSDYGNFITDRSLAIAAEVGKVAQEAGASSAQVALSWIMHQPGLNIPIIGARKLDQLQDNLGSVDMKLSQDHLDRLNEVSAIEMGFPMEFLNRDYVRNIVFGGFQDQIDNHRA